MNPRSKQPLIVFADVEFQLPPELQDGNRPEDDPSPCRRAVAAQRQFKASGEQYEDLSNALRVGRAFHGFNLAYKDGLIWIFSADGHPEYVPIAFLNILGEILSQNREADLALDETFFYGDQTVEVRKSGITIDSNGTMAYAWGPVPGDLK